MILIFDLYEYINKYYLNKIYKTINNLKSNNLKNIYYDLYFDF